MCPLWLLLVWAGLKLLPWSSGYGRRLKFQRLWVRIPARYTGWTFLTFICSHNCIICLKRSKITKKRPRLAPFFLKKLLFSPPGNSGPAPAIRMRDLSKLSLLPLRQKVQKTRCLEGAHGEVRQQVNGSPRRHGHGRNGQQWQLTCSFVGSYGS